MAEEVYMMLIPKGSPLDVDGYPTEEFLNFVRKYDPTIIPLKVFLDVLQDAWYFDDWGFIMHRPYRGIKKLELHTGGWSGNEETIEAIKSNIYLTHFIMKYTMWKTGGHYFFDILTNNKYYNY